MKLQRLFTKTEYAVACRFSKTGLFSDSDEPFAVLKPTAEEWYADPFAVCKDGKYYVFMEVMSNSKGYGSIGVSQLDENGELSRPKIVLDTGSHLSFPLIFDYNGKTYMTPESVATGEIPLYECVSFPDKWVLKDKISEGVYCDTTVFENNGKHFAFTSSETDDLYGCNLFLMELDENLHAVRKKLISKDYKISRQAGNIFYTDGSMYRVAQNCDNGEYGYCLEFLEITDTAFESYNEKWIKTVLPQGIKTKEKIKSIAGTHTFNRVDDFEVVDLKLCPFSLKATYLKFRIVFKEIISRIFHR